MKEDAINTLVDNNVKKTLKKNKIHLVMLVVVEVILVVTIGVLIGLNDEIILKFNEVLCRFGQIFSSVLAPVLASIAAIIQKLTGWLEIRESKVREREIEKVKKIYSVKQ